MTRTVGTSTGGELPCDSKRIAIQQANRIVYEDGAGTPVVSPKTGVDSSTGMTLVPPAGALMLRFSATQIMRYGNNSTLDGSGSGKGYKTIAANTDVEIPCCDGATIYIKADSSTGVVNFCFTVLT